jgi:Fe-S cluster assembly ATP-binding protein
MSLLEIKNLHARIEAEGGPEILRGLDLSINAGEVHAIMGPNGSGKSTLSYILGGRDGYEVTEGEIRYQDQDLLEMDTDVRACEGVFLAFQYPVELPGVNGTYFMRTALNSLRAHRGEGPIEVREFAKLIKEKAALLELDPQLLNRSVNEGFSGGEKKRNEILQMAILEPKLAILDETDSGLDIDALQVVANGVNTLRSKDNAVLLITHYQRLLDYVVPDYVHVLVDGKIVKSGTKELALELEAKGYSWIRESQPASV